MYFTIEPTGSIYFIWLEKLSTPRECGENVYKWGKVLQFYPEQLNRFK